MKILKRIIILVGVLMLLALGVLFGSIWYSSWQEQKQDDKFSNINLPEGEIYVKPKEYLEYAQLDSLDKLDVRSEKIVVVGTGYSGYDFFMWHKPTEKGEIYIKAFEETQNQRLSERKLTSRTKNIIIDFSNEYQLYKGRTVIDEGTFEEYYPTRFELWFKSAADGNEKKLTEITYLIDGWDR